eukprot:snap_masked-scaffold_38-processed-gene-1.38-mRNA-1 protein AED:1.00 eAED:1.00 QI:0/-1/0/0/-1/1/1/0/242
MEEFKGERVVEFSFMVGSDLVWEAVSDVERFVRVLEKQPQSTRKITSQTVFGSKNSFTGLEKFQPKKILSHKLPKYKVKRIDADRKLVVLSGRSLLSDDKEIIFERSFHVQQRLSNPLESKISISTLIMCKNENSLIWKLLGLMVFFPFLAVAVYLSLIVNLYILWCLLAIMSIIAIAVSVHKEVKHSQYLEFIAVDTQGLKCYFMEYEEKVCNHRASITSQNSQSVETNSCDCLSNTFYLA